MNNIVTPKNINELSREEVLQLIRDNSVNARVKPDAYAKNMEIILKGANYVCNNDLFLAMASQVQHKLVIALAGGGKTSFAIAEVGAEKIVYPRIHGRALMPDEVLCLVYNKQNPKPVRKKHESFIVTLLVKGLIKNDSSHNAIMPSLEARTLHSFALEKVNYYLNMLNLGDMSLDQELCEQTILAGTVRFVIKDKRVEDPELLAKISSLIELAYNNMYYDIDTRDIDMEMLLADERCCEIIADIELVEDELVKIFKSYKDSKFKFFKRMTYMDYLVLLRELLIKVPFVVSTFHEKYKYIMVDEVQDFSDLMFDIVHRVVGPQARLLMIGDDDQGIYGFRGASSGSLMNFNKYFPDGKTFQLTTNFRCSSNVLSQADKVISKNEYRIPKVLRAVHSNGELHKIPYLTREDCIEKTVQLLSELTGSRAVIMREKVYFTSFSFALYKKGISYYLQNAQAFFMHQGFKSFVDVLNLLRNPYDKKLWINLYKICPFTKKDWSAFLDYNKSSGLPEKYKESISSWHEIDIAEFSAKSEALHKRWENLKHISSNMDTVKADQYIPHMISWYRNDYWERRVFYEKNDYIVLTKDEVYTWIEEVFSKDLYFVQVSNEYYDYISNIKNMGKSPSNVCLSTIHGSKGLEYNNVIMAYLSSAMFPNLGTIEHRGYSEDYKKLLIEEEIRLAYVAMTRSKNDLYMLYDAVSPSILVDIVNDKVTGSIHELESVGATSGGNAMVVISDRNLF